MSDGDFTESVSVEPIPVDIPADVPASSPSLDTSVATQVADPTAALQQQDLNSGSAQINAPMIEEVQGQREEKEAIDAGRAEEIEAPRTAAARYAQMAAEAAKKRGEDDWFDAMEQMAKERERREEEWRERMHDVGGMAMSGADLEKLINFIKSPAAKAKIESALKATGMDQKQIDKAQKEAEEFAKLKEKEKTEGLTPEEKHRLDEINKSQEFKVYMQTAREVERRYGQEFTQSKTASFTMAGTVDAEKRNVWQDKTVESLAVQENVAAVDDIVSKTAVKGFGSASPVEGKLAATPQLSEQFAASVNVGKIPIPKPANEFEESLGATAPVVAKASVANDSFSASLG